MTGPAPLGLALTEQMLAASADGVLAFDAEFRLRYWNVAMETISGLRTVDVLGQVAFELFPFLLEIGEDAQFHRALAGETTTSRERPFDVPGTGRRGFFEARYGPLRDAQGRVVGGFATIRDITAEKRAAERIGETESRFRNMADVSPVMLWMSDTDGLCTFFNQTWLRFTGRTLEQEWGVGWAESVHFEDFQRCMDTYAEAFGARRVFEMEYRLQRADGAYRWVLDRGTPRYTPDGTFAGYIGSCIDITERKHLEADLRAAVRVRDDFLSVASHELKTPLTSLQLQVDYIVRLLQRKPQDALGSGRFEEGMKAIGSQTVRLAELIEALLDVSRITSGRLELEPVDVDLTTLVRDIVLRWDAAAGESGSTISTRLDGAVPGRWDRLRLEQIVGNLLSNAIKYGRGKPIEVSVDVDVSDGAPRLVVADHGIGIPQSDHKRIFERFERAVSARNYGGLGLGLWIVRQIVEAMHGAIQVADTPGGGATFVVRLPAPLAGAR
jgi:PAS domain S-box-containing protein